MKANQKFQIDAAWWKVNKPKTLPDPGLGGALQSLEAAHKALKKAESAEAYEAAALALKQVRAKVGEVLKRCKKGLHDETIQVLSASGTAQAIKAAETALEDARKTYAERVADTSELARRIDLLLKLGLRDVGEINSLIARFQAAEGKNDGAALESRAKVAREAFIHSTGPKGHSWANLREDIKTLKAEAAWFKSKAAGKQAQVIVGAMDAIEKDWGLITQWRTYQLNFMKEHPASWKAPVTQSPLGGGGTRGAARA